MMLRKNKIEFLPIYKEYIWHLIVHTLCSAKFGEDVIPVKEIPLIDKGCYYTCQAGYIHAIIFKQTFDSSLFAQKQKDSL